MVPIISRTDRLYPGEGLVEVKGEKRKAMASQLATASKLRIGAKLGVLVAEETARVEAAVAVQLGLNLK